jgi:hypothetical protein
MSPLEEGNKEGRKDGGSAYPAVVSSRHRGYFRVGKFVNMTKSFLNA